MLTLSSAAALAPKGKPRTSTRTTPSSWKFFDGSIPAKGVICEIQHIDKKGVNYPINDQPFSVDDLKDAIKGKHNYGSRSLIGPFAKDWEHYLVKWKPIQENKSILLKWSVHKTSLMVHFNGAFATQLVR